jgi:hypothetical protein
MMVTAAMVAAVKICCRHMNSGLVRADRWSGLDQVVLSGGKRDHATGDNRTNDHFPNNSTV